MFKKFLVFWGLISFVFSAFGSAQATSFTKDLRDSSAWQVDSGLLTDVSTDSGNSGTLNTVVEQIPAVLYQDFMFTIKESFSLSFKLAWTHSAATDLDSISVDLYDMDDPFTSLLGAVLVDVDDPDLSSGQWFKIALDADTVEALIGKSLELSFSITDGDGINDSLEISSTVPEPSTFVLLGFGAFGLGLLSYRRSKATS